MFLPCRYSIAIPSCRPAIRIASSQMPGLRCMMYSCRSVSQHSMHMCMWSLLTKNVCSVTMCMAPRKSRSSDSSRCIARYRLGSVLGTGNRLTAMRSILEGSLLQRRVPSYTTENPPLPRTRR